jgi:uncharacterized membrane protein
MESNSRSLVKAVSYRILGSSATALIVFILTGRAGSSALAGVLDMVIKVAIYYVHERIWDRINFGRAVKAPEYEI